MRRFFSTLKSAYDQLIIGLNYISVAVIFLMAFLVFSDVVGRYFFNHPIPGTTELVKCAIIVIIFFGHYLHHAAGPSYPNHSHYGSSASWN